jgi:hypothetical protein
LRSYRISDLSAGEAHHRPYPEGSEAHQDGRQVGGLEEKMDKLGIGCELYAGNKRVGGGSLMKTIDFLKLHFGMDK